MTIGNGPNAQPRTSFEPFPHKDVRASHIIVLIALMQTVGRAIPLTPTQERVLKLSSRDFYQVRLRSSRRNCRPIVKQLLPSSEMLLRQGGANLLMRPGR